jgi:hypothetical protein
MMPNRRVKARTAERREKTLQLVRSGMPYRQVVRALKQSGIKTSPATISRDMEFLYREYREQSLASVEEAMTHDLERLDDLLQAIWFIARGGNLKAVDRVLRVIDQRARILGYGDVALRERVREQMAGDLTAEEEAVLLTTLEALRAGRVPPIFDEARYLPEGTGTGPVAPPEVVDGEFREN